MKYKDAVWNFFDIATVDGKTKATCKTCKAIVSSKRDRLQNHQSKCVENIDFVSNTVDSAVASTSANDTVDTAISLPSTPSRKRPFEEIDDTYLLSSPSTPKRHRQIRQRNLSGYATATDQTYKTKLDEQIARLFYSCNLPFNLADNKAWRETIEMLRPGYEPPNRKLIAGDLLETTYEKTKKTVQENLTGNHVTIIQDGWSDAHNHPVIATSAHVNNKSYFLSAVETGSNKKTADYCTSLAMEAISNAEKEYSCSVTSVCTDNEKKMQVMRKNIHDARPDVTTYGCSPHWMNLLGEDITPSTIMSQVVEISKFFRNHHRACALLDAQTGSVKPQLPCQTRWNSQVDTLQSYLRNRPYMLLVCAQNEDAVETRIKGIVNNIVVLNEAKHLVKMLSPISKALDTLQSDSATVSDATEEWLNLAISEDLAPKKNAVKKRMDQALTPAHFLAHMLHPRYRGKGQSPEQIAKAQDVLLEMDPKLVSELLSFTNDSCGIPRALNHPTTPQKTKPDVWWQSVSASQSVSTALCSIAVKLMKMPASSGSLERVFSNFSLIQNKLRNRLGLEKAAKLVFCYRILKGGEELEW